MGRVAVQCGHVVRTWAQLGPRVHRLARAWENRGFDRGDKVAAFLTNSVEVVQIIHSLARVAVVNVTINAKFKTDESVKAFDFSDAVALVVDEALVPVVSAGLDRLPALDPAIIFILHASGDQSAYSTYEQLLDGGDEDPIDREPKETDYVWMAFTGGTTGEAKACLAPHRALTHLWSAIATEMDIRRSDVGLIASSMNHGLGIQCGARCSASAAP